MLYFPQKANLGKQGGCHLSRYTMATLMLENGADIRFIQAMLGHADLKSTQIYTHVAVKQLKAIHEATHPAKTRKAKPAAGAPAPRRTSCWRHCRPRRRGKNEVAGTG